jgi:putative peptidoglycan lipid II flippase
MTKNNLFKSTFQITVFSLLNIGLNFFLQLVIAYYYGTSFERDAYLASIVIPTYLNAVFTGSVGFIFLTKFQEAESKNNQNLFNQFLTYSFGLVTILLVALSVAGIFFAKRIISFSVPGFDNEQVLYTSRLLAIVLPSTVFFTLSNLFSSIYQARQRFVRPALIPLFIPLTSFIFVLFFNGRFGIFSLAYGFLVGTIISCILLSGVLPVIGFRVVFRGQKIDLFKSLLKKSIPLFLFGFIFRFTTVFERMIASGLESGSISYLGYSNQILSILATIASSGIAVSLFPLMSKYWIENKKEVVGSYILKGLRFVLILTFPLALIMVFWGDMFIKLLLERGVFTHESTISVSICLSFMMGALIFQSLGNILVKVFYFSGKTWIISLIASLELVVYIILGLLLSKSYSYVGLALALSISSMINILISTAYIDRFLINLDLKKLLTDTIKVVVISILSVASIKIVFDLNLLKINDFSYLLISILVGYIILYWLGILVKLEEFSFMQSKLILLANRLHCKVKV